MTKEELITEIRSAFKNVKLEDGTGIWEGQGIDDYADSKQLAQLRRKDEKENWDDIPYKDLVDCSSSLSFFDAKGMRFCLPKFLIFDILSDQIYEEQGIYSPDVLFTLGYETTEEYEEYHKIRFSLFDNKQTQVIIHYLEYKMDGIITKHKDYSATYGSTMDTLYSDHDFIEISKTINVWKQKLPPMSV